MIEFGTDGVRGVANADLSPELVMVLGRAVARVLSGSEYFVVGRDTRRSGPMLQAALSAGIASEGVDVVDLGVIPTPGVAWVAAQRQVPGAMVSASHNPFYDNGVKVFAAGGAKLPDAVEEAIEAELVRLGAEVGAYSTIQGSRQADPAGALTGSQVGMITSAPGALEGYVDHLVAAIEGRTLGGLEVVLDCANGAASRSAPAALRRAGAKVVELFTDPDGMNINDGCGSTHPDRLMAEVVERGSDLGLALDGDADRCLAVDHTGTLHSGDEMLALFAADLAAQGRLARNTLVVTVMSNMGLHKAMAERGIKLLRTQVGDRYVLEALDADNLSLGGEQSGHIVFRDLATTGDGTLTGLLLADLVCRSGSPLAELAANALHRYPQHLVNVPAANPRAVVASRGVVETCRQVEADLGTSGRVLLRPSGTEPLVRVMVEASDALLADQAIQALSEAVSKAAGELDTGAQTPQVLDRIDAPEPYST